MKKSQKITFSAMLAALGTAIMLVAYFPYLTITVPAAAGIAVMLVFAEAGAPYAAAAYIVCGLLSFLLCDKEAALLFICLFGYYPVVKAYFERIKIRVLEWAVKLVLFNAAVYLSYRAAVLVTGVAADDIAFLGKWGIAAFIATCNAGFVIYDRFLSVLATQYYKKYRARLSKMFRFLK